MTGSADAAVRSKGTAPIPVTVVQPNVGQEDKWEGSKADANFAKLARLTTPKDDAPRLVLWPEAALTDSPARGSPSAYYDRSPAAARPRVVAARCPVEVRLRAALQPALAQA